jgi:isoleucyl-tRNA synthetase
MSRELIRRVQDMRKDQDLDVEANIEVYVECSPDFQALIENFLEFISNEIRADKFVFEAADEGYRKEWKIEEHEVVITIKKS